MYKAYKFRLYPSVIQKDLIHKTFGCVRFVYNYFLNECNENDRDINASINIMFEGLRIHYQS